ncbi:hypothetical protein LIER_31034 [Lithospermum erythrorhizon]|uniref:Uncharacterized protein n=1 Tax=Lithospermum erythrorhizon TaxID=34254 RepID=A0AAV3RSW9_LITER
MERAVGTEEAHRILEIPLSRRPMRDKLIWHYTKCGSYLTSSGYHCAIEMHFGSPPLVTYIPTDELGALSKNGGRPYMHN